MLSDQRVCLARYVSFIGDAGPHIRLLGALIGVALATPKGVGLLASNGTRA